MEVKFIEDFVVNSYYKVNRITSSIYYFKLRLVEDNNLFVDGWYIWNGQYSLEPNSKANFVYDSNVCFEQVELSELVKYLPLGHSERITYRNQRIKILLALTRE